MPGRFYSPLAIADETHTHTDDELRSAIDEIVSRQATAEHARREAWVRGALTNKVREEIERALEGHRGVQVGLQHHVYDTAAQAAVGVFVELLTNPPTIERHPDGTEKIRWTQADR